MDTREFLISATFLDIIDNLKNVSSICTKPNVRDLGFVGMEFFRTGLCIVVPATQLSRLRLPDE